MADYYPLLRRAIGGLDRPDERARYDVYERARQALVRQLQATSAPDAEVDRELGTLDAVIARIENEIAAPAVQQPAPPARVAPRGDPPEPAFVEPADTAAALRRPANALMIVGVLAAIVAAGFGAYYFVARDRARPATVARTEPQQAAPAPAPQQPPPVAAPKQPPSAAPKLELVPTDEQQAPYMLRRQRIFYRTTHPPGTIVVSRSQKFLYLVQPNQVAIRYAIGTGPECENVAGLFHITEKLSLPASVAPGATASKVRLGDQFGPRALYFDAARAVHGAADPHQVGGSATVGCFLSWKPDIVDLYDRVQLNDRIVVVN